MRPIYLISKTPYPGVVHIPILTIKFSHPNIDFTLYDGLIITSKEGARALSSYTMEWEKLDILCVGEATAAEISSMGGTNITVAEGYGDSLLDILENQYNRWLYLRPKMIASSWPSKARAMGKKIDEVIIYETTCNEQMEMYAIAEDGILIFTSPSSIECFLHRYPIMATQTVIAIGQTTQKALPHGVASIISETTTVEACVKKAQEMIDSRPF